MLCDQLAMSMQFNNRPDEWYESNKDNMKLYPKERRYYEDLLKLLKVGGYILVDNVYFHGLVRGQEFVKHKLRTLVVNLRKFIDVITTDNRVETQILDIGDGIAIIKKL